MADVLAYHPVLTEQDVRHALEFAAHRAKCSDAGCLHSRGHCRGQNHGQHRQDQCDPPARSSHTDGLHLISADHLTTGRFALSFKRRQEVSSPSPSGQQVTFFAYPSIGRILELFSQKVRHRDHVDHCFGSLQQF